jgi:hypothetical protein
LNLKIDFNHILIYGSILSVMASAIILISLYLNPRLWLQDYPKEIQQKVSPKTKKEKRQSLYWGIPFLIILFAIPFFSAWTLRNEDPSSRSFLSLFLTAFGVGMFFNIVDLLIIDFLVVCLWRPRFLVLHGTEGMKAYRDYFHHFRAFMVGTVVSLLVGVIIAAFLLIL